MVYQRLRNQVISHLELLADQEGQLKYQSQVPIAHVSHELIEQWCDLVNPEGSKEQFPLGLYSAAERSELHKFNQNFIDLLSKKPNPLPHIEEFQKTLAWEELRAAAVKTHAVMMKRGVLAEDRLEW